MFVELHIIQSFPPSNLNRDDVGQPKTTDFGGVRRARISSQCQKRAIRFHPKFKAATQVELSKRTQLMVKELQDRLAALDIPDEQAHQVAMCVAKAYAKKKTEVNKTGRDQTPTLIFLSKQEFDSLAGLVMDKGILVDSVQKALKDIPQAEHAIKEAVDSKDEKAKKTAERVLKDATSVFDKMVEGLVKQTEQRSSAPDIALFGRMLADRTETNIDAACQVAHAISVHGIGKMEIDYYTAMDDVKQELRDPGAGFLDSAYFNSACFYRYMRIDCSQLQKTLQDPDLVSRTVRGFMLAAEAAVPPGKINSHAHDVRPSFMLAVVRKDQSEGWNLVNAFEKPVHTADGQGIIEQSVRRLESRFSHLRDFYGKGSIVAVAVALPDGCVTQQDVGEYFGQHVQNMEGWVNTVCAELMRSQEA